MRKPRAFRFGSRIKYPPGRDGNGWRSYFQPDPAVEAVIFTVIAVLDESADIDIRAVYAFPDGPCLWKKIGGKFRGTAADKTDPLFFCERFAHF